MRERERERVSETRREKEREIEFVRFDKVSESHAKPIKGNFGVGYK